MKYALIIAFNFTFLKARTPDSSATNKFDFRFSFAGFQLEAVTTIKISGCGGNPDFDYRKFDKIFTGPVLWSLKD